MGKKIAYVVVRRLLKCHISRTKTACRLICTYIIHILCNYTLPIYRCMHVLRVSGRELMEVILGSGSKSFDQFLALLLLAAATCLHPARTLDLFLRGPIPKREKSVRHSSRSRSSPPNGFVAPAVGGDTMQGWSVGEMYYVPLSSLVFAAGKTIISVPGAVYPDGRWQSHWLGVERKKYIYLLQRSPPLISCSVRLSPARVSNAC